MTKPAGKRWIALERVVRGERETADPRAAGPRAAAGRRRRPPATGSAVATASASTASGLSPRRSRIAALVGEHWPDRPERWNGSAASGSSGASSSANSGAKIILGLAEHLDRRRRARLRMAQHEPRLDSPAPFVSLEPEGRVERLPASPGTRPPHPNATARARVPPDVTRSGRDCRPPSVARSPKRPRARGGGARGCPSRTARARRAPRPVPMPSSVPRDDRVDAFDGLEQLRLERLRGVTLDRGGAAPAPARAPRSAPRRRDGLRSARARPSAACSAPSRSKPGMLRPDPCP